jgi:hypothetical protein
MKRSAIAAVGLLAIALAVPAVAANPRFVRYTLTEQPKPGLPVTGPLKGFVVTSRARVVIPTAWRRDSAPPGQLRFTEPRRSSCQYTVTYRAVSVLAPPQSASAYAQAKLPGAGRLLLDGGVRRNTAFRVVRRFGTQPSVRLDGLWVGVLTKRADIAPAGMVAWTEIRVTAASRPGDACHSGTYRDVLGPAIGDSLAVARTGLHFVKRN